MKVLVKKGSLIVTVPYIVSRGISSRIRLRSEQEGKT